MLNNLSTPILSCFVVTMKWNEATEQWRMINSEGKTIQEFFDCGNVCKMFPQIDKTKENKYQIMIKNANTN